MAFLKKLNNIYYIRLFESFLRKTFRTTYCQRYRKSINATNIKEPVILGIETSCDDTGAAIVDGNGNILGEGCFSQVSTSVSFGGVIPSVASKLHKKNIDLAVKKSLSEAQLEYGDLTAIAATVKPGNIRSLRVGVNFAKEIVIENKLPFIPIHHMEAHALTARMLHQISFPFIALLVSGGHSVLALASSITEWKIIGDSGDIAVGVALDHVARRLKLKNIPGMAEVSGGRAIEILASEGDPKKYNCPVPLQLYRNCNFSFSGLESWIFEIINELEQSQGIEGGRVLPQVADICASFQFAVTKHLIRKTHKAFRYLSRAELIDQENKLLVISGGVASNKYIRGAFEKLCISEDYKLFVPPSHLCTDNGIMIAWNGIERWNTQQGVLYDEQSIKSIEVQSRCPLGPHLAEDQERMNIKNPAYIKF